jgi:CheY-like chemotaxis protein/HPt (histidine-containing phosphotransfer) domain-containing protein
MNETPAPSDHNELSDDDLAVLRAFEMTEELASVDSTIAAPAHSTSPLPPISVVSDDMLVLFVTEADGEIAAMRQALQELEQNAPADLADLANSASLQTVQRSAHKLKGTAGSVGFEHITTITRYIEILVGQVKSGIITHLTGLIALAHAIQALEATLYNVASEGREDSTPQTKLEEIYKALNVELPTKDVVGYLSPRQDSRIIEPAGWDGAGSSQQSLHVDAHQLEQLLLHIEQLAEQRTSLEQAQEQVESAQQEFYAAQQRLQRLESRLSTLPSVCREPIYRARASNSPGYDEPPMSSLVARILNESVRRVGHVYRRKNRLRPQSVRLQEVREMREWDELEIGLDTSDELLVVSLSEAIADVTTASTRLRTALEQLGHILQKHIAQMALVCSDARRLPHTHDAVRGLLIRVGSQCVVVPFEHIRRIEYEKHVQYDPLFALNELLNFPTEQVITETARTVLILQQNDMAVQVDEVVGEIEVVIKPLASHLQRPGIAGTAIGDIGEGNVLLVLNLSELVMRMELAQHVSTRETAQSNRKASQQRRTVLIADDSVYIRQSVLQILNHAGYEVMEARDGIEALEQLLTHHIDALLLDIEMPRLNGYDLLNIIRVNPLFARLKVVMLTSRSSEKHQRHAYVLGAHGYLTKPCPQDILLTTVESLLHATK